ncbi:UNVERIFIED_CONTAM: putative late blight resistance proteinR1A-10 [Sesamum angustifolium]|uniref:Late blight resistance proteinR1A-10 n=1 Tax=Sesamum angustifolium TaxID=2727405 RepID=A0AAW2QA49_9LAMI
MWDTEIWDAVRRLFPDDGTGSRVLLTTRISDVAEYANSCSFYHMRFLKEEDSWNLLCRKVFGEGACPLELEEIGKEIARKCGGLPLSIVVIGGLLSKTSTTQEYWRSVANNLNAVVLEDDDQCLEILSLSYNHLPHHLRACFLYTGVFPEDHDIPVSKLISLWAAEGFLKPNISKSMEEVAEGYLKDLVERSLVFVSKKSSVGKIKTCKVHDLLRDLCLKNARKENFFHVVNRSADVKQDSNAWRRLSIQPVAPRSDKIYRSIHSITHARSLLCSGVAPHLPSYVHLIFRLLRVWDVVNMNFDEFPVEVTELVCLRYLAFTCDSKLPPSISKLRNLETLVHHKWKFGLRPTLLPRRILMMPKLRHLLVSASRFPDSLGPAHLLGKNFILENLQTLSELENLVNLHQLETLALYCYHIRHAVYPEKLALPLQLRELTLSGLRLPWYNLKSIGALPNLEVLKLRRSACQGPEWRPMEEEFCQLKFLLLEGLSDLVQWRVDDTHFPRLQRLIIRSCYKLEEIPSCIGDISTLQLIELDDCNPSAMNSAEQIQEEQQTLGNYDLQVYLNK